MASMTTAIRARPSRATFTAACVGMLILVLMAGSLVLTGGSAVLQVAVLLYAAITVCCVVRPEFAILVVLALLLVPLTIVADLAATAWMDARYLVVAPMAALVLRAARSARGWPSRPAFLTAGASWPQRSAAMFRCTLPAFIVVGSFSTFWSIDRAATVLRLVSLLTAAVFCVAAARTVPLDRVLRMAAAVGWVGVALSIALLALAPGLAVVQGRAVGIFSNANGLAAFLVVLTPIMLIRLRRTRWPAALLLFGLCVTTGSRAGSAALAVELLVLALANRSAVTRVLTIIATGVLGAWFVLGKIYSSQLWTGSIPLLRNNNSRASVWATGFRYFEAHPMFGLGVGALPPGSIGGIVPEMLATCGLVGSAIIAIFVLAGVAAILRAAPLYTALLLGALADVQFEPWLFTGGSMFCIAFWLVMFHPESLSYRAVHTSSGVDPQGDSEPYEIRDHVRA